MEINLNQDEIEQALKEYVGNTGLGIDLTDREIKIDLKAGRGENGHSANIVLVEKPKEKEVTKKKETSIEDNQAIDFEFEEDDS